MFRPPRSFTLMKEEKRERKIGWSGLDIYEILAEEGKEGRKEKDDWKREKRKEGAHLMSISICVWGSLAFTVGSEAGRKEEMHEIENQSLRE